MSVDADFSCDLPYEERALPVHREFTRVRGCELLPEHRSASQNCILSAWEQAIVEGRSPAVVRRLLNSELAGCDDVIEHSSSFRKVRAAELRRREAVQAFDEINRLILKWSVRIPNWTPALALFQRETLQRSDGRSQRPACRPHVPATSRPPACMFLQVLKFPHRTLSKQFRCPGLSG
jgi:hypothetical protein